MCQRCLDALNTHWPHIDNEESRYDLLWNCTAFPNAQPETIENQLAELARRSGGNLSLAFAIADWELAYAMENPDSEVDQEQEDET